MEQIGCLLVLLASFSALSWMTALADTVAAHPSGLWLSLSPPHSTFARGEKVSLICSPPERQRPTLFYFYEKRNGVPVVYGQQAQNILEVSTEYLETNKTFVCAYLEGKRLFLSSLSNEVVLSITDLPPAPVFSVSPKKDVYTSGESVELKCSSSETRHVSRTQFFRDQQYLHSITPSSSSSSSSLGNITHTLHLLPQDGGNYSCRYHIVESGREIASRESNSIRILVLGKEVFLCNTDLLEVEVGSWIESGQFGWSQEQGENFIN
ncbi:uncharacterized protein LOC118095755 [Zootoca vivipara]|uniref:uncharacterized protein LOC118095755 n=1 Tax=Zootoca vivipara TaxID=8524 RepID=UPI00293C0C7F|nr:uncharacterized protein LOC118095755 [Zootoca vivipara]